MAMNSLADLIASEMLLTSFAEKSAKNLGLEIEEVKVVIWPAKSNNPGIVNFEFCTIDAVHMRSEEHFDMESAKDFIFEELLKLLNGKDAFLVEMSWP